MLYHSSSAAINDDDVISSSKGTGSYPVRLYIRSEDHRSDMHMSMSAAQAKSIVKAIQTLIDAEFGPAPADNVVTLTPPEAA